jgi:ADP-heptose:LPS heptosyltransferase
MAEDGAEACAAATLARFDVFECTARKAENVAPEWNDAIPYNADDERTCAEIMCNHPQTARPKTQLIKLPAYIEAAIHVFANDPGLKHPEPRPRNLLQKFSSSKNRLFKT